MFENSVSAMIFLVFGIILVLIVGIFFMIARFYKKVPQGKALIRTGLGGVQVADSNGLFVIPVLHMHELMDLSVKTIEINRMKEDGLICKDNLRADIKVAFYVRVDSGKENIKKVAQTISAPRASNPETLRSFFEAKFSEALKTVGKRFDFVELYDNRLNFKHQILQEIGKDLNGYSLDDCAIDYLEQTPLTYLKEDNILDSEGIKKITELTAKQKVKSNFFKREEEKTIKEQNVEAQEAILEYDRQLAEKQYRQKREIANIKAREEAEIIKIEEEERLRANMVRIKTEEELNVAEEDKQRQVIIALKSKERTEAIENERVDKDRLLEKTEKDKLVEIATIEKQKAVEIERRNIQDVIRERVMVEKKTVEEEEKIKDTRELATAERQRQVVIVKANQDGEAMIITKQKEAEAAKLAAVIQAEKLQIDAKARKDAAEQEAEARKINAEAKAAEEATLGLSEAQVIEAKAKAKEQEGLFEANIIEKKAFAEAKSIELKADALKKQGLLEAEVLNEKGLVEAKVMEQKGRVEAQIMEQKYAAEAKGVAEKAKAMLELDGAGKEHEEFKLQLEAQKEIAFKNLDIQRDIANAQAEALGTALKSANIDIVGGEDTFIKNIMGAIGRGKAIDKTLGNSQVLSEMTQKWLTPSSNGQGVFSRLKQMIGAVGVSHDEIKKLSMLALMSLLYSKASDDQKGGLKAIQQELEEMGIINENASKLI